MKITNISQCSKALDFSPRVPWPARLPAFSWRGFLLSGFDREDGHVIELDSAELLEIIWHDIYPKLSLTELARFYDKALRADLQMEWPTFFHSYGIRFTEDTKILMRKIVFMPAHVQKWCVLKDVSARDLAPLKALNDWDEIAPWWQKIVLYEPSRADGVRALEWLVDLNLMGVALDVLLADIGNFSDAVKRLRVKRFPLTEEKDQQAERLVRELPWPKKLEARYVRHGDKTGYEVKLFVRSTPDLQKQIEGLKAVESELEKRGL
jgi:hypothetical protein